MKRKLRIFGPELSDKRKTSSGPHATSEGITATAAANARDIERAEKPESASWHHGKESGKSEINSTSRSAVATATKVEPEDISIDTRSVELNSLIGNTIPLKLRQRNIVKSIAFISNKGGVGKTHLSTNMSFYLKRMGKDVLLIDLDLGNSDVTNKLGYYCEHTITDLLGGKQDVNQLTYQTPHGFDLIAGEPGNLKLANLNAMQRQRFIRAFKDIGDAYEYVMFDLSAGIGTSTLDFALAQDYQIVVTTPQDIVAGYSCIKAAFERFQALESRMQSRDETYTPQRTFRPFIVVNQVGDFEAGRCIYNKLQDVLKQHLGDTKEFHLEPNFLGAIVSDQGRIRESELNRFLYCSNYGATQTGQCYNFLVQNLIQYRDPNNFTFTTKIKRFVDIFLRSMEERNYAV
jgi:flagellar biosynthesis protein FlhG